MLDKKDNILKKEGDAQHPCNNGLDQVTAASGIYIQ
jgi:hypothetical protein